MTEQTSNLYLLEDLEGAGAAKALSEVDLDALRATADWMESFVARPHRELGRAGPICPFVPGARERRTLWLAPERVADLSAAEIRQLVGRYQGLLLDAEPVEGEGADLKSIVMVLGDLPPDRAKDLFDDLLGDIAVPSYRDRGLATGGFYPANPGSAIYNPDFHPFRSPVPFLLMRPAVVSDWKFFLDDPQWLDLWARRFGPAAAAALADELRRLPWRTRHDQPQRAEMLSE